MGERLQATLAVGAALWTGLTLKLNLFQHPKLIRTSYRMPSKRWAAFDLWEGLQRKGTIPGLSVQVELQHARKQVWMRLEGALSARHAEGLGQRIHELLARSRSPLVLDLKRLHWDKVDDLRPLCDKLAAYRSRIRLVLPTLASTHPELRLLAGMFHQYRARGA